MKKFPGRACLVLIAVVMVAAEARAQQWSAEISAGQTEFESVSSHVATTNMIAGVRYEPSPDASIYGAGAAPLRSEDAPWGVFGAAGRIHVVGSANARAALGVDLAGQGYIFRDSLATQTGTGGTVDVMPFTSVSAGASYFEVRAGWRGHRFVAGEVSDRRSVIESGARAAFGRVVQAGAETRVVRAPEGTFPFAGVSLAYRARPVSVWLHGGKWLNEALDESTWSAGVAYAVNARVSLSTSVRQDAPDPLYWNPSRRTWNVGMVTRLGKTPLPQRPMPTAKPGRVELQLPVSEAPPVRELWVAGTFNEWRPTQMRREGNYWVLQMSLPPGIYQYAFRTADGRWFVPASVAGRRSDGFGGHVAVLVVG